MGQHLQTRFGFPTTSAPAIRVGKLGINEGLEDHRLGVVIELRGHREKRLGSFREIKGD